MTMKIKNLKRTYKFLIISWLLIFVSTNTQNVSGASYTQSGNSFSGTLDSKIESTWEDSQWQYFKTSCSLYNHLVINLSYSGDLDLDLWIFVDEVSTGAEQNIVPKDITHCQLTGTPTKYSHLRTLNTTLAKENEHIYYINSVFNTARDVYILVFVQDGVGSSAYTLMVNNTVTAIPADQVEACWTVWQAWLLFGVGCAIFSVLIIIYAKKSSRTREKKSEDAQKKAEKKQVKSKMKKKESSSMNARRGGSNRR
jgi:hypothetical protein